MNELVDSAPNRETNGIPDNANQPWPPDGSDGVQRVHAPYSWNTRMVCLMRRTRMLLTALGDLWFWRREINVGINMSAPRRRKFYAENVHFLLFCDHLWAVRHLASQRSQSCLVHNGFCCAGPHHKKPIANDHQCWKGRQMRTLLHNRGICEVRGKTTEFPIAQKDWHVCVKSTVQCKSQRTGVRSILCLPIFRDGKRKRKTRKNMVFLVNHSCARHLWAPLSRSGCVSSAKRSRVGNGLNLRGLG